MLCRDGGEVDFGGGWELRSGPGGVGDVDDEWRKAWGAWDGVAATGAGAVHTH